MLFNAYRNRTRSKTTVNDGDSSESDHVEESADHQNDIVASTQNKTWLKFHTSPKDEVEKLWSITFQQRREEILSISKTAENIEKHVKPLFEEWPLFSKSYGHVYVRIKMVLCNCLIFLH